MVLTVCIIIHSQPHVDRAFPHLWAIFENKLILLSALDGQKFWERGKGEKARVISLSKNKHKHSRKLDKIKAILYQILGTEFWLSRRCSFWCCPPVRGQSGNICPGRAPRYASLQDNLGRKQNNNQSHNTVQISLASHLGTFLGVTENFRCFGVWTEVKWHWAAFAQQ